MAFIRQQQRRDTSANWAAFNPVLLEGELGVDTTLDRYKIGDGTSVWSALPWSDRLPETLAALAAAEQARDDAIAVATGDLDPANGVLIRDPDTETGEAVLEVQAESTVARRDALLRTGRSADALSAMAAERVWEQAGAFFENWPSAEQVAKTWTLPASGVALCAGNQLRGVSAATNGISKSLTAGDCLIRARINYQDGGAEHLAMVGLTTATLGSAPAGGASNMLAVGVRKNAGSNYSLVLCINGVITDAEIAVRPDADASWDVTVWRDATHCGAVIHTAGGQALFRVVQPLTSFAATQLAVWHSDARGDSTATGVDIISARNGKVSHPYMVHESRSATVIVTEVNGQALRVALPIGWDSRHPLPVSIYYHGINGTEADPFGPQPYGTNSPDVTQALLANGYAVVSCANGGGLEVGSGYTYTADVIAYLRKFVPIASTVVWSESFGTSSAAHAIASGLIPDLCAWAMIFPVTNLTNAYADNPAIADAIDDEYGSLAAAIAFGADPSSRDGFDYLGVPVRIYQPTGDTVVRPADSVAFAAKLAPFVSEAGTPASGSGNHGSAGAYQPSDLLAFFDRATGRVPITAAAIPYGTDSGWVRPSLASSWVIFDPDTEAPGYRLKDGLVHIRGLLKSGTVGYPNAVFNLPVGMRPTYSRSYPIRTNDGGGAEVDGAVFIENTGNVHIVAGANNVVFLDVPPFPND